MCQPASFIITKDQVFWGTKSDSHEEIIKEHGLHADGVRGANIVRVEIVPVGGDFRLPLDEWKYKLDQDEKPKWYDAAECEARVRETLPRWLAAKIILPDQTIEEFEGNAVACYGTIREMRGSAQVGVMWGSAHVGVMRESAQVREMWESAQVGEMRGSAQVGVMRDSATIQAYTTIDPSILKSAGAVIIDRTGKYPVCHVGKDEVA